MNNATKARLMHLCQLAKQALANANQEFWRHNVEGPVQFKHARRGWDGLRVERSSIQQLTPQAGELRPGGVVNTTYTLKIWKLKLSISILPRAPRAGE